MPGQTTYRYLPSFTAARKLAGRLLRIASASKAQTRAIDRQQSGLFDFMTEPPPTLPHGHKFQCFKLLALDFPSCAASIHGFLGRSRGPAGGLLRHTAQISGIFRP